MCLVDEVLGTGVILLELLMPSLSAVLGGGGSQESTWPGRLFNGSGLTYLTWMSPRLNVKTEENKHTRQEQANGNILLVA